MQVSVKNFFIHPESNVLYEEGVKREITFSDKKGVAYYKQTFNNNFLFMEFINNYCTPWRKEHLLPSLFQKNIEGLKALKEGLVIASTRMIKVIIHEELLEPYALEERPEIFHFFTAIIKTKSQCFNIYTKGLHKYSKLTSSLEYEYNGLKNRETGETIAVKTGPSLKRQRSYSLP